MLHADPFECRAAGKAEIDALLPKPLPVDAAGQPISNGAAVSVPAANGNHVQDNDDDDLYGTSNMDGVTSPTGDVNSSMEHLPGKHASPAVAGLGAQASPAADHGLHLLAPD